MKFGPIYSDINTILDNVIYDYKHPTPITYDKIKNKYALLLAKYPDEKFKIKMNSFYKIIGERNYHLSIFEEKGKHIINRNVKNFLQEKGEYPKPQQDIILLEPHANIEYSNMRKGSGRLHLPVDLLFQDLGFSVNRNSSVESCSIFRYYIHTTDRPTLELQPEEFSYLWEKILVDSEQDKTFKFLRESVDMIKELGEEIKKMIENI